MAVPTWNRKIRVFADWTLGMFLKREVVSLGAMERPRGEFYEAAAPVTAAAAAKETQSGRAPGGKREDQAQTADSAPDSRVESDDRADRADSKGEKAAAS
jgi:NADH dehydrogenase